jgi:hypothetical protein
VFQNYLSYSVLTGTDDKAVAGGLDDCSGDGMKVIYAENALDLSEKPSQEPEISASHPNEARYHFRDELLVGEDNSGRRPTIFKQILDLRRVEWTELMYESDARVELRKTSYPFLNSRHSHEHHTGCALVKDGPHLFETVHLKTIRLIHQD